MTEQEKKAWDKKFDEIVDTTEAKDAELSRLHEQLCAAREAIQALLTMMARGGKPRKLDDALSWIQNDTLAQEMALDALKGASCPHAAALAAADAVIKRIEVEEMTKIIGRASLGEAFEPCDMDLFEEHARALRDYLMEGK